MGTFKEEAIQQEGKIEGAAGVEENLISGPPASRNVIDNLKKLLVQRQHSRESDYEGKNGLSKSASGSNSDAAFYSQFSSSSSESDSDSEYLIFEDISNQENRKSSERRRFRRRRSYSSSSSSSQSPVEKRRRKRPRNRTENEHTSCSQPLSGEEDSANTSSHKDSSSDDENVTTVLSVGNLTGLNRLPKFKRRRDRNRKCQESKRPASGSGDGGLAKLSRTPIPTIVISHVEDENMTTPPPANGEVKSLRSTTDSNNEKESSTFLSRAPRDASSNN